MKNVGGHAIIWVKITEGDRYGTVSDRMPAGIPGGICRLHCRGRGIDLIPGVYAGRGFPSM